MANTDEMSSKRSSGQSQGPNNNSKEQKTATTAACATAVHLKPRLTDVVFGRGTPFMDHAGNLALHELTDTYMPIYKAFSSKSTGAVQRKQKFGVSSKQEIVDRIVDAIHDTGGRFLRKDKGTNKWIEVSLVEARRKVCHILRGHARKRNKRVSKRRHAKSRKHHARPDDGSTMGSTMPSHNPEEKQTAKQSHHQDRKCGQTKPHQDTFAKADQSTKMVAGAEDWGSRARDFSVMPSRSFTVGTSLLTPRIPHNLSVIPPWTSYADFAVLPTPGMLDGGVLVPLRGFLPVDTRPPWMTQANHPGNACTWALFR